MKKEARRYSAAELAKQFLETCEKETILAEIFDFFEIACLERCNLDVNALDQAICALEQTGWQDAAHLTRVIELIQAGEAEARRKELALIHEIKAEILKHLFDDITLEEIAHNLYISYYYMCHFFKKNTGLSVNTFRTQKRLEKAIRLLWQSDKKISEIAVESGFNTISYFTEIFTKNVGISPLVFREKVKGVPFHAFYEYDDLLTAAEMPYCKFLSKECEQLSPELVSQVSVKEPDEEFQFLHELAIIEYHGVLYASWYQCPQWELRGYTPICGKRSYAGGKTWSELEFLTYDPAKRILYCPPVYGIDGDTLYLLVNQMVAGDHIHSLDLYVLNNETQKFELRWSRPVPFKLNTNVVTLPNGKKMLPGRVGELDGFPNTPAVLISDSGRIDDAWRLVKIAENGDLPDGKKLIHPELTAIVTPEKLFMFCRNDQSRIPLVYFSEDQGEHWSPVHSHDIPYISSKIYCGELQDGRHYMLCNIDDFRRTRMVAYFTEDETPYFTKELVLFDEPGKENYRQCHYPAAYEFDGKLYVIATMSSYQHSVRGAQLFILDLKNI